jgi:tetratricopeptide (TPR) repeat protein
MEYMRAGQHKEALDAFSRSGELVDPDVPFASRVLLNIGHCLILAGKPDVAKDVLTDALAVYPDYTDLRYMRGSALSEMGECGEALSEFEKCLAMGDAPAWYISDIGVGGDKARTAIAQITQAMRRGDSCSKDGSSGSGVGGQVTP